MRTSIRRLIAFTVITLMIGNLAITAQVMALEEGVDTYCVTVLPYVPIICAFIDCPDPNPGCTLGATDPGNCHGTKDAKCVYADGEGNPCGLFMPVCPDLWPD